MRVAIEILQISAGVYRAHCLALPGCVASGHSPEDVRNAMVDAVHGYLASFDAAVPGRLDLDVAVSPTERLSAQLTVS